MICIIHNLKLHRRFLILTPQELLPTHTSPMHTPLSFSTLSFPHAPSFILFYKIIIITTPRAKSLQHYLRAKRLITTTPKRTFISFNTIIDYISKRNQNDNTNQSGLTNHNSHWLFSPPPTKETVYLSQ